MPYLLDTDVIIDHLEDIPGAGELIEQLSTDGIAISIFTFMEVWQGILRSPQPDVAKERFGSLLSVVPIIPFSEAVARRTARLREDLKQAGRNPRRRAIDLMIAGTALEYEFTVVTRNTDDYKDIPNLRVLRADIPSH
jgi:predicted nucleic acid-binding protein